MAWTAAGIPAGLVALVGLLAARRDRSHGLGSVSGSWIADIARQRINNPD